MLCDSAKEKPARMTIVPSRPHYSQQNLTDPKVIVASEKNTDTVVRESLQVLGLTLLSEWDTLAFLYNHLASLGTAAQIAQFVGGSKAETLAALTKLEALGLIQRSRVCQGKRIYLYSPPSEPSRQSCLVELMIRAQTRAGRLQILQQLKNSHQELPATKSNGLRLA